MNKKCKELLRKNNDREKKLLKSNNEIYTDMIVYLRGSDMTMYNQELVREDLIQMILDGQDRGEDIQKVMGCNYKEVCDEIIENMPKRTKTQKLCDIIESYLSYIWIIGFITIIKFLISGLANGENTIVLPISVGDIINMLIIIIAANLIVNYIIKNSFKNKKENKIISFIKLWLLFMLLLSLAIANAYFLDTTLVTIPLITAIIIVGAIFITQKLISNYIL
ncbi:hypothetical protein ACPWSR_08645 [Alloiococcus sp. CFN-8]|uniref:hypothetical protein n=1 Tax=Alloiococcus sp. CFN-8 TaxID=3416081 RepID=UPI003CF137E7